MGQLFIGLMSGTSMDGVDAVLVEMNKTTFNQVLHHEFIEYPAQIKNELLQLQVKGFNELAMSELLAQKLAGINNQVVQQALLKQKLLANDITAIGCHGQTIRHVPESGFSIQLMNWALLSELTHITTVGDFRSKDIAAKGQGAPLVPAFHQSIFAAENECRVVLNLGGIANISVLNQEKVFGFDTGPANMLMDAWVFKNWQKNYDDHGLIAKTGVVLPSLLTQLLSHSYFKQDYPKSTGRDLFSLSWLQQYLIGDEKPEDVLRTLLQLTAESVSQAITKAAPMATTVYACGGGVSNHLLMDILTTLLLQNKQYLTTTATLHLPPQQVEAAAFAWLAACWIYQKPIHYEKITGAIGARILGCGYWEN